MVLRSVLLLCLVISMPHASGQSDDCGEPGLDIQLVPDLPMEDRLHPGRVELAHTHLGDDDSTWVTDVVEIGEMTRFWGDLMRGIGSYSPLLAPGPMTREQLLSSLPDPMEVGESVLYLSGEHSFGFSFDSLGRIIRIDWDPVADSGIYRFHYSYEPSDDPPVWVD